MKIAIINTVCQYGSTGRLAYGLYQKAKQEKIECKVFFGRGEERENADLVLFEKKSEVKFHALMSRLTGKQGFYSKTATKQLLYQLMEFKPDVLVLMNLHGYYLNMPRLFNFIYKEKIPVIQMLYDEYSFTGRCPFTFECEKYKKECIGNSCKKQYPKSLFFSQARYIWNFKKKCYDNIENIVFMGAPYVANKAHNSSLLKNHKIVVQDEGDELKNIFFPHNVDNLREKLGIPKGNIIILNVAPYSDARKGVELYYELAKRVLDRSDITFVHVGLDIAKKNISNNVIPIKYIKDLNELSDYYALADLFVCTSFADTVPNTCIEALGCGVKICGFNISGIPYSAEFPYGEYVDPGDISALERIVRSTTKKSEMDVKKIREYALNRYDKEKHFAGILNQAKSLMRGYV